MSDIESRIGFMQGRLTKPNLGVIQQFPKDGWKEEFDKANKINLRLMEWTLDNETYANNPLVDKSKISTISALKEKFRISIPSLTADCFMQSPLWDRDNEACEEKNINRFHKLVKSCQLNGIEYIVMPLVDNSSLNSTYKQNTLLAIFSELTSYIRHCGIKILFESDLEPKSLSKFIEDYPEDTFGINYDIGNSASLGYDVIEEISLLKDRIMNVHVKDRKYQGCTVPLGEGDAKLHIAIQTLRRYGYKGNFILQTARTYDGNDAVLLSKYRDMLLHWLSS